MGHKSYEHFNLNTSTSQNDAWQSLTIVLHTNVWTMKNYNIWFKYTIWFKSYEHFV